MYLFCFDVRKRISNSEIEVEEMEAAGEENRSIVE